MNLASNIFLYMFLPCAVGIYYLIPAGKNLQFRNLFLLLASLFFYAWGEVVWVFLLVLLITATHFLGLLAEKYKGDKKKGKRVVTATVILNVGVLFVFKYLDFTLENIGYIINHEFTALNLALPLGISFFVFQSISYVIDIYRKKGNAQKNILNTALYLALFIKITSGPIVQYNQFENQLLERKASVSDITDGVWRFIIGLGKKALLASNLSYIVSEAFSFDRSQLPVSLAWMGALAYMLQLYFDFSGYSDMAIGLGKMFGFDIPENFDYPYASGSVTEFWRRWHRTLGEWFKDYMYYPLMLGPSIRLRKKLSKKLSKGKVKFIQNLFIIIAVWSTTGLWHGAKWNYLIWGLLNGLIVFAETYKKPMKNKKLENIIGWGYTFLLAFMTKPLAYAESISDALSYYGAMFGLNSNPLHLPFASFVMNEYWVYLVIGLICSFPIYRNIKSKLMSYDNKKLEVVLKTVEVIAVLCVLVLALSFVAKNGFTAFIYQKF